MASSAEVVIFWAMHYIEAINNFSQRGVYWYKKTQNFMKMHLRKLFEDKDFCIYTGGPLCI
jgi:hypothetical protein